MTNHLLYLSSEAILLSLPKGAKGIHISEHRIWWHINGAVDWQELPSGNFYHYKRVPELEEEECKKYVEFCENAFKEKLYTDYRNTNMYVSTAKDSLYSKCRSLGIDPENAYLITKK